MRIWLVTTGEPIPSDPGARLLRHGILAGRLQRSGHEIDWWSSTFDHNHKRNRAEEDTLVQPAPSYRIHLIHTPSYRRNISLARLRNHRVLGERFARAVENCDPPDVILASFPTIELAAAAVEYGRKTGTPVVADVRDMWPDIFLDVLPRQVRGVGRTLLADLERTAVEALRGAHSIIAMSEGVLQWALGKAGRERAAGDRVFMLGYERKACDDAEVERARVKLIEKGVDPSKSVYWFIGQFGRQYDVETIVEAARLLQARGRTDIQFVLCGDGDKGPRLQQAARGLPNVVFTGWVEQPAIAAMMRIADAGLAAAFGETGTVPNKLFEYMAAGIPILSCIQGEAAELLENCGCGWTYEARDPSSLAASVLRLADDRAQRDGMAENSRRAYAEKYNAETIYSALEEYLAQTAKTDVRAQEFIASRGEPIPSV